MSTTEQQKQTKTDRNGNEVNVLRDKAKYTEDIQWKRDTGMPVIDNAVIHDDLAMTIEFKGNQYNVRSPDIRIVEELEPMMIEAEEAGENLSKQQYQRYKTLEREFICDMIPGLDLDDRSVRIDETDMNSLIVLCWRYKTFLTRKSARSLSD